MIARWATGFALVLFTLAPQAPPRDVPVQPIVGTGIVAGVVMSGATGSDPARNARVMLNSVSGGLSGITAATDDDGRFEIRDVPAGRFTLEVYKPGYLRAFYGAARPNRAGTPVAVANGARVDGLTVRLLRGAAISGTVRDARGRPVLGITVNAYRYGHGFLGELRLSTQRAATTDDRGEYRLWGLTPGEYVVAVTPQAPAACGFGSGVTCDFTLLTVADVDRLLQNAGPDASRAQPAPSETGNYAPVFYPATHDLALATRFAMSAGDERDGVDIALSLMRTARIVGQVSMPAGQAIGPATVTLSGSGEAASLLGGSGTWRPRSMPLGADGRFMFQDVLPGTYRVLVQSTLLRPGVAADPSRIARFAMADLAVNGADVNVALTMQPAMVIAGRIIFDGTSPPPDNLSVTQVRLVPPGSGGDLGTGPPGGQVGADGTFTFTDVTPSDYRVMTSQRAQWSGDWWLRGATANGRDVWDAPLTVAAGDKTELVLTYTDRPTQLSGQFQDATGRPAPDYFIVVFSADKTLRTPGSRRISDVRPDNTGHYSIRGLPPGEYLLAALTDLDREDVSTPTFFDQLAGLAVRVTLAEGRTTTQDLRVGR